MRKMLFFLLITPLLLRAQQHDFDANFRKATADLGKPIHMPSARSDFDIETYLNKYFAYSEAERIFYVTEAPVYHKLFSRYVYTKDSLEKCKQQGTYYWWMDKYLVDSLPVIDFSKNRLIVYSFCELCLENCLLDGGASTHRGSCDFRHAWFIRSKEPLLVQKTN